MAEWIDGAKSDIVKSDDWESVSDLLHQAVLQQLKEFHVSLFSELNDVERDLCINRALKLIENHQSYQALFKKVSVTLQQALLEQVRSATQDHRHNSDQGSHKNDSDTQISSETDRIVQYTADAAAKLLEKRPQFRKRLYLCFNRRLPQPLRDIAWKLQLRNESIYQECLNEIDKLQKNRQLGRHLNIKHRCKAIIHTEPLFAVLAQEANLPDIMEIILSYRQSHLKDNASLVDTDYMLLLPFLYLKCGDWNDCTIELIATTIEYYTIFMSTRREHMKETGSQKTASSMKDLAKTVINRIKAIDIDLYKALRSSLASPEETSKPLQNASIYHSIASILRPLVRSLFVGFLPMDVVCFIWDQIIIGMSNPQFDCIPAFCASILLSLRQSIIECKTIKAVEETIIRDCRVVSITEVQYQIEQFFYKDLRSDLYKGTTGDDIPIIDPIAALSQLSEWTNKVYDEPFYDELLEKRKAEREQLQDHRRQLIKEAEKAGKLAAKESQDNVSTPLSPTKRNQQHHDQQNIPKYSDPIKKINELQLQVDQLKNELQKSKLAASTAAQSKESSAPEKNQDHLHPNPKEKQDPTNDDEVQNYNGRGIFDDGIPANSGTTNKVASPAASTRTHLPSILFGDED